MKTKIKIKSLEDIKNTLDEHNSCRGIYFILEDMGYYCGKILETKPHHTKSNAYEAEEYTWVSQWYDVIPNKNIIGGEVI